MNLTFILAEISIHSLYCIADFFLSWELYDRNKKQSEQGYDLSSAVKLWFTS